MKEKIINGKLLFENECIYIGELCKLEFITFEIIKISGNLENEIFKANLEKIMMRILSCLLTFSLIIYL